MPTPPAVRDLSSGKILVCLVGMPVRCGSGSVVEPGAASAAAVKKTFRAFVPDQMMGVDAARSASRQNSAQARWYVIWLAPVGGVGRGALGGGG
jgi:hypothetical protein